MNEFYMVSFECTGNFYFFRDKEDAFAFVLESYCDEMPKMTNEEIGAANQELADTNHITNYAWIDECWFED